MKTVPESLDRLREGAVLAIDKPLDWTSADVVRRIKFQLSKMIDRHIKVGHAGTLDPKATGVLLVCVGRATKQVESLQAHPKEYVATLKIGATTPSFDTEHEEDATYPWEHVTPQAVREALDRLTGEREQYPPAFSAKMIDGHRAYNLARKGREVEMNPAVITIYGIELLECELPMIRIRVRCSKGTYIRSLAREIGEELGSGAYLTALRRTANGDYREEDCLGVEEAVKIFQELKQKEDSCV